ncbi:MAG: hypothetical protein MUE88_10630 [Flavobacteriales bacterium]|nr:hypothetical protein [Flavobacteriales bacterium]
MSICPWCKAPQDARRHLTPLNIVAALMLVALVGGIVYLLPLLRTAAVPTSEATLNTSFRSVGNAFHAEVVVANRGSEALLVTMVRVEVRDEQDRMITYIGNEASWGADFAVAPGSINSQQVSLGLGPGARIDPVVTAIVQHANGSTQVLVDSTTMRMSNGKAP